MEVKEHLSPEDRRRLWGEDPQRILGMRLRALREAAGLSQGQLAQRMTDAGFSMHQTTIGKIELNERDVSVNEAVALASVLGVALADLLADPELDAEAADLQAELQRVTTQRMELERERAGLRAQVADAEALAATAKVRLALGAPELREMRERERELDRRLTAAQARSKGHSPTLAEPRPGGQP
jgi:transcriptional regulator with XRE-family HTH domain